MSHYLKFEMVWFNVILLDIKTKFLTLTDESGFSPSYGNLWTMFT